MILACDRQWPPTGSKEAASGTTGLRTTRMEPPPSHLPVLPNNTVRPHPWLAPSLHGDRMTALIMANKNRYKGNSAAGELFPRLARAGLPMGGEVGPYDRRLYESSVTHYRGQPPAREVRTFDMTPVRHPRELGGWDNPTVRGGYIPREAPLAPRYGEHPYWGEDLVHEQMYHSSAQDV